MSPGRKASPAGGRRRIYYEHNFNQDERSDLQAALAESLVDEISMLRVVTRRLFALAGSIDDLEEMIATTSALGQAATRLAGLLKNQHSMSDSQANEVTRAISTVISEMVAELKLGV